MKTNTRSFLSAPALKLAGGLGLLAVTGLVTPTLTAAPILADIGIGVHVDLGAPPPPRHEVVVERDRPGPDYVWMGGYWDGAPGHYVWVNGHWDRPPHGHEHGVWVAPHYERDHDGHYVRVEGRWR